MSTLSSTVNEQSFRTLDELPLFLTVSELGHILRLGRNSTYDLLRCGAIHSIKVKGQLRVPKQAVINFISAAS